MIGNREIIGTARPFSVKAGVTVETGLFVKLSGENEIDIAGAADPAIGFVVSENIKEGEPVYVQVYVAYAVLTNAAIVAGDQLERAAGGKAQKLASGTAFAVAASSGNNNMIECYLKV